MFYNTAKDKYVTLTAHFRHYKFLLKSLAVQYHLIFKYIRSIVVQGDAVFTSEVFCAVNYTATLDATSI